MAVVSAGENSESRIADELKLTPFFMAPFGARKYCFIPRWSKWFNSFDAIRHPEMPYEVIEKKNEKVPKFVKKKAKIHGKKVKALPVKEDSEDAV